jgi:hypothetical protein
MLREERWLLPAKVESQILDLWLLVAELLSDFYSAEQVQKADPSLARFV